MYRAFYRPANGKYREVSEDRQTLGELSSGAILVIKINEDGTRELIEEKKNPTAKEEEYIEYGKRQLEFKHDGGTTPAMVRKLRESRE